MTTYTWIKLYIEILDDPKVGLMPDWAFRRFIQFLLYARERNQNGLLGPVSELAWRLRSSSDDMLLALRTMSEIGIVAETPDGWLVVNFAKRQAAVPSAERVSQYRERKKEAEEAVEEDVTKRYTKCNDVTIDDSSSTSTSNSLSDSLDIRGGVGGKTNNCATFYQRNFGALTSAIADDLNSLEADYGPEWLQAAMTEALRSEARNLKYVAAILKRWKRDGFNTKREPVPARGNGQTEAARRLAANKAAIAEGIQMAVDAGVFDNGGK